MKKNKNIFMSWFLNNSGATAVEYGLIAAALAVTISGGIFLFGDSVEEIMLYSIDLVSSRP